MEIEIKQDSCVKETKVIIITDKITEEINDIVKKLSEDTLNIIPGFREDTMELIEKEEIFRIYSQGNKVYACTDKGEYLIKLRLYEAENMLCGKDFVRISNSEIINLRKVKNFDLKFTGTICVKLENGTVTFVSRRYISKIKQILGL